MNETAQSERRANSTYLLRTVLASTAAWLCAFTVVIYQSWFMPYFLPFFTGRDDFARLVFHTLYGGNLIAAIAVLIVRRDVLAAVFPLAIAAIMAIAPVVLHPVGIVTECYLITLFLGGAAIVFMLASSPVNVLRISASVTALGAVICLFDLLFLNSFTDTPGRAAGLALNPNVGAAGLLLGAAASYRAVPTKWRASFLVLVTAALFATVSRSTLLAALGAATVPTIVRIWQKLRNGDGLRFSIEGGGRAVILAFALLGVIGIALATNPYFRLAINDSFAGMLSVNNALDEAAEAVSVSEDQLSSGGTAVLAPPLGEIFTDQPASPEVGLLERDEALAMAEKRGGATVPLSPAIPPSAESGNVAKMQALGERLTDEGRRNSISARALFLERGLLAYREGGFFGRGLEAAQAFAPHNTFLLFAIAFGHIGWLIPIGVVGFAFCFARRAGDLALGTALIGVMLTSHDLLLTPSLFLPVAVGIGGLLAERRMFARKLSLMGSDRPWSFAFGTASGVVAFAAGCFAIVLATPPLVSGSLRNHAIFAVRGGYEALLPRSQFPGLFQFDSLASIAPMPASLLRENEIQLRRVDWAPRAWPAVVQGEYTFRRRDAVLFAATDSSDPRKNGRTYEFAVPVSVSTLCFVLLGVITAWTAATMAVLRRPIDRSSVSR